MKMHKEMHEVYWLSADERGASRHAKHGITTYTESSITKDMAHEGGAALRVLLQNILLT